MYAILFKQFQFAKRFTCSGRSGDNGGIYQAEFLRGLARGVNARPVQAGDLNR